MKNKSVIILLLSLCFLNAFHQSSHGQSSRTAKPETVIKLKALPEINDKAPVSRREINESIVLLMTSSASRAPSLDVQCEGIDFSLAFDRKSKRVIYIGSRDAGFKTADGLSTAATFAETRTFGDGELIREPGWAFYIKLKSGWYAAFIQGTELTEGELLPETKISFFFKK